MVASINEGSLNLGTMQHAPATPSKGATDMPGPYRTVIATCLMQRSVTDTCYSLLVAATHSGHLQNGEKLQAAK